MRKSTIEFIQIEEGWEVRKGKKILQYNHGSDKTTWVYKVTSIDSVTCWSTKEEAELELQNIK